MFDTVEVNATFHALPAETTVRGWYERTPPGFLFALKVPQHITHDLRLQRPDVEAPTAELVRLARLLEDKCGPLLVQLPPSFEPSKANRQALHDYLDALPENMKVAVELRHARWASENTEVALSERNAAWVLVDGDQPNHRSLLFPADFTYVRWNRSGLPMRNWSEVQHDRSDALEWWTQVLTSLPEHVKTVYGYMSNEFAGHAPASLRMLCQRLGLAWVEPRQKWQQQVLF